MLTPLADILGVTVAELLKGERLSEDKVEVREVNKLVDRAVQLTAREREEQAERGRFWRAVWVCTTLLGLGGSAWLLMGAALPLEELAGTVFLTEGLCILFGVWVCFFIREKLPAYYDKNKISFYGDGVFRMNFAGVHFNNSNWPHIVRAMRVWLTSVAALFPWLWLLLSRLTPAAWGEGWKLFVTLLACLGFFLPAGYVGRKYE